MSEVKFISPETLEQAVDVYTKSSKEGKTKKKENKNDRERESVFEPAFPNATPPPQDPLGVGGRYFQLVSGTLLACCLETFSEFPKCS